MRKPSSLFVGISSLLFAVLMAGCGGGSSTSNITIALTASGPVTIDQGQSVDVAATVTNDSSNKGVTWTITGAGSLANSAAFAVTYNAPVMVPSTKSATVTATSVADNAQSASITITVNPAPAVTSSTLPSGTAGVAYSQTLGESGGTAPFTWGVISGQIPPGLSLNSSTGVISGNPTTTGTFNFIVQVIDAAKLSASAPISTAIGSATALAVSTTTLPNGAMNLNYSSVLQGTGGVPPYSWTLVKGSLPSGLVLSSSGIISGTPAATGTATFTVRVADSANPNPATAIQTLSLIINPVPFSITTPSLPNGTVGIGYGTTLAATGGVAPYTWSVAGGSLPAWAALDSSTGTISGKPTATGTITFTILVTDAGMPSATATQVFSITINSTQNTLLFGHYAFALGGYDGGLAGSFTADGQGNLTGGVEDLEVSAKVLSASNVAIVSGSYAVGSDGRGALSYTDANSNTFSFDFALSSSSAVATTGAMIESDASGDSFTGVLALQDPAAFLTSSMNGGYAFGFSGWDSSAHPDVVLGSATISGGAVSAGLLDENDAGTLASSQAFTGAISIAPSGRGTMTSSVAQANFVFYVVSSGEWLAVAMNSMTGAVRVGTVLVQGGQSFSNSFISGTMVYQSQGAGASSSPQASLGLLTSAGSGSASLSLDVDDAGRLSSQSITAAVSFSSGTNGRFTLTPQGGSAIVGYMVAPNQAFLAGTSANPSFGSFLPQSSGTFTQSSIDGSFFFGTLSLVSVPSNTQAPIIASGALTFDGEGNLSGAVDSVQVGTTTTTQLTDTYSVGPNGRVTLGPTDAILYIVSSSKAILLSIVQNSYPNPFLEIIQR